MDALRANFRFHARRQRIGRRAPAILRRHQQQIRVVVHALHRVKGRIECLAQTEKTMPWRNRRRCVFLDHRLAPAHRVGDMPRQHRAVRRRELHHWRHAKFAGGLQHRRHRFTQHRKHKQIARVRMHHRGAMFPVFGMQREMHMCLARKRTRTVQHVAFQIGHQHVFRVDLPLLLLTGITRCDAHPVPDAHADIPAGRIRQLALKQHARQYGDARTGIVELGRGGRRVEGQDF
jgi:hypothetical protein